MNSWIHSPGHTLICMNDWLLHTKWWDYFLVATACMSINGSILMFPPVVRVVIFHKSGNVFMILSW